MNIIIPIISLSLLSSTIILAEECPQKPQLKKSTDLIIQCNANETDEVSIDANSFYDAEWARQKGLYAKVYDSTDELDEAVQIFAENLCKYNPEAMKEMKKVMWEGTENWNELLAERAAISGRLVLSEFTKETLKRFS